MCSQQQAVKNIIGILDEVNVPYMIVGSYAASIHGLSRATHDLDLVVALAFDSLPALLERLGDEFYWDTDAAMRAIQNAEMFNAIHLASGLKVDFWVLADNDFANTQFERRRQVDFDGALCWVASAEDTILSKMMWYNMSHSERQLSDIKAIIPVCADKLDIEYILCWAQKLELLGIWKMVGES